MNLKKKLVQNKNKLITALILTVSATPAFAGFKDLIESSNAKTFITIGAGLAGVYLLIQLIGKVFFKGETDGAVWSALGAGVFLAIAAQPDLLIGLIP